MFCLSCETSKKFLFFFRFLYIFVFLVVLLLFASYLNIKYEVWLYSTLASYALYEKANRKKTNERDNERFDEGKSKRGRQNVAETDVQKRKTEKLSKTESNSLFTKNETVYMRNNTK